jgi:hypothetical protein
MLSNGDGRSVGTVTIISRQIPKLAGCRIALDFYPERKVQLKKAEAMAVE